MITDKRRVERLVSLTFLAVAVGLGACKSNPPNTVAGTTTTTQRSSATTGAPNGSDTTKSRSSDTSTGTKTTGTAGSAGTATTSSSGDSDESATCALLTVEEVKAATGKDVVAGRTYRSKGCSWDDDSYQTVVRIDAEDESQEAFDLDSQLFADPDSQAQVDGIGDSAYYNGLSDWVSFRVGGTSYEVAVDQIDDTSRKKEVVIELARKAAGRT